MRSEPIIRHRGHDHAGKHDDRPVHIRQRGRGRDGEEAEDEADGQEAEGDVVDQAAPAAQAPPARQEGLVAETLEAHAADGGDVGEEQGGVGERDDGVEGDVGAEVEGRDGERDAQHDDQRVNGQVPPGAHVFDVAAEGETLVAGEGPDLARGGGDAGDGADHGEQDQHRGHDDGARDGVCALVEHLDDRYAGLGVFREAEHVVLPVRSQAEAECDQHDQAERRVAERGPHHGRRQHTRGVFELFRHVRASVGAEEAPEWSGDANEAGKAG